LERLLICDPFDAGLDWAGQTRGGCLHDLGDGWESILERICVFCGSSPGARPEYVQAACHLGETLAQRGLTLVYGGAKVGTMGHLAHATLAAGGKVIGVIPRALVEMEVAYVDLPDLRVVDSMHARKATMADLADGFIALPGGLGTIEEFFEVLTWGQLGLHHKPCGLLNVCGYYDRLIAFLDHTVEQQFVQAAIRRTMLVADSAEALLDAFVSYSPPWINKADWILRMSGGIR
jgi:uncharacterized protein (TIGR00730 family)